MGGCAISKLSLKMGKNASFLIISLRYIGDVLVTTPLAQSIKEGIPGAHVEYLVFAGTESVLANNPYVDRVNTIARGSRSLSDVARLFRKYDYALATNPSDRTTLFAALFGKKSIGLSCYQNKEWWKPLAISRLLRYDDNKHVVSLISSLLRPLDIPFIPTVTMAFVQHDLFFVRERLPQTDYVVLHPYSRGRYKYWAPEEWAVLAGMILQNGLQPVFTVTPDPQDRELLTAILAQAPDECNCLSDPFTLSQLAAAIHESRAYVGIDTVVTHIATAVGAPTIAILGPTLTRYWAPWPNGCTEESPFALRHGIQRVGNVTVVQKEWPCVPCNREYCAISSLDRLECLSAITAKEVFDELCRALRA